jgi:uncharacterized protein involved in exopolysaccharide biosynthesis
MDERELQSENLELFDGAQIKNYIGFFLRSIKRRKKMVFFVFAIVALGTIGALKVLPKTYHVETKVLAVKSQVLQVRGDMGSDALARTAAETVLRHENLVAVVKQTDLPHTWYQHRAPALALKDKIFTAIRGEEPEQDRIDWMVDLLEKKMNVWSTQEGAVTIQLDFPDPQLAFHIVEATQQNFLEARHVSEISAIAESVSILQSHATSLRDDIDTAVEAIQKLRAERDAANAPKPAPGGTTTATAPRTAYVAAPSTPRRSAEPDPAVAQLKVMIEAKQRAITDLEDFRRHRLLELQAKMAEQRAVFTENHPAIVDLQQTIDSLSTESPQVITLRKELASLQDEYAKKTAKPGEDPAAKPRFVPVPSGNLSVSAPQLPTEIVKLNEGPAEERDPAMTFARRQLSDAMEKYATLRTQIQAAQIDLETAQAAFKYRYSVITPAQVPKNPIKPNAPVVTIAGIIAGLMLGMFLAVVADIRTGKLIEKWQVERLLDMPLLAEIDVPDLPPHDRQ